MGYPAFDLSGKTALVTGGNRGIGLGIAHALAQAGADVVIWGTNSAGNERAAAQLRPLGVRVLLQQVDVSDETAVVRAMTEAVAAMGAVHVVVANAGIPGNGAPLVQTDTAEYRRVLAVNLDGAFFTFREACRHMVQRAERGVGGGSLVGVGSLAAVEGAPRNGPYAAAKGALVSLVRSLAVEHARFGVRANVVLPGWIATDMTAEAQGRESFTERVIPRVPMKRWGEPADFGGLAVYLASDSSRFHTGDTFVIDGGYSIY